MDNSAYVPNHLPPPSLVVFSQAGGLPEALRMQRPFNPQVSVLLSLPIRLSLCLLLSSPICFSKRESGENNKARSSSLMNLVRSSFTDFSKSLRSKFPTWILFLNIIFASLDKFCNRNDISAWNWHLFPIDQIV